MHIGKATQWGERTTNICEEQQHNLKLEAAGCDTQTAEGDQLKEYVMRAYGNDPKLYRPRE
jgi:hypothetical protein